MDFFDHTFTFSEVVAAAGVGEGWLRTFIQRDKSGTLGVKDKRLGRLLFSGLDVARIAVLHDLNAGLKVAPAGAWEVVYALEELFHEKVVEGFFNEETADHETAEDAFSDLTLCIGYASDGTLLCWHVNDAGGVETFNDASDDHMLEAYKLSKGTHIAIPLWRPFGAAAEAAKAYNEGEVAGD